MTKRHSLVFTFLALATGCAIHDAPSADELQSLLRQARVEAAAGQLKEAEKKLLLCIQHCDKNSYLRLASLNQLINVELLLHNDSKAKFLTKEAGADGEAVIRDGAAPAGTTDGKLLEEARRAIFRWADSYAEIGSYDSARTLYRKAQIIEQRSQQPVKPEDSAEYRLKQLDERMRREKHALEHDNGLEDKSDPGFKARAERTAARKRLLAKLKECHQEMASRPSKQTADRVLSLLPQILTAYGVREIEYRGALNAAVQYAFMHGDRNKALSLLKEDMAKFENISQAGIDNADPTTLENANFMITDLTHLAMLYLQIGAWPESAKQANKAIALAQRAHCGDTVQLSECLKALAVDKEQSKQRAQSIPIRQKQIAMLKRLNLTDNHAPYYEAHLELGRTLTFEKKYKEALPLIDYAIARLEANQPDDMLYPYALTAKAQLLFDTGDFAGASQCLSKARDIYEKHGSCEGKFGFYRLYSQCLQRSNKPVEAEQAGKCALTYAEQLTDNRNQAISDCCQELANLEDVSGKNKEALAYVKRALHYQLKVRGENDISIAGLLNYQANLETRLGRSQEAEKLRLKAVAICRTANAADKTALVSTILQLANFYHSLEQSVKAIPLYREALAAGEGLTSPDGLHFMRMARIQLAQVLVKKDRKEAEKLKDQALAKLPTASLENPIQDCNFFLSFGDLCMSLQDLKQAEIFYKRSVKAFEKAEKTSADNKNALFHLKETILTRQRTLYKVTKHEKLDREMFRAKTSKKGV